MNAIRQITNVKSGSIKIDLPANFKNKKVEIIILPIDETENGSQSLQDLLLEAPTLSSEELENFNDVRKWMNKWNVEKF